MSAGERARLKGGLDELNDQAQQYADDVIKLTRDEEAAPRDAMRDIATKLGGHGEQEMRFERLARFTADQGGAPVPEDEFIGVTDYP